MNETRWQDPAQRLWIVVFIAFIFGCASVVITMLVPSFRGSLALWIARGVLALVTVIAFLARGWSRRLLRRLASHDYLLCPVCRFDLSSFCSVDACACPGCRHTLDLAAVRSHWRAWETKWRTSESV